MITAPCSCGKKLMDPSKVVQDEGWTHMVGGACFYLNPETNEFITIGNHELRTNNMNFTTYVRKPFTVDAVEVTKDNIGEIAKYVGDLKEKDDGTPYILVDRRLVPIIDRVYPGFWMTKIGDGVRCYSRKVFLEQFTELTTEVQPWLDFLENGKSA